MKKQLSIVVLSTLIFFSCSKGGKTLYYDKFDQKNVLKEKVSIIQKFKKINKSDFELTILKSNNYKKTVITKEINDEIYLKCDGNFILSHGLKATPTGSCYYAPPILNHRIKFNGKKVYIIDNVKYEILYYGESNGSESDIATYFLKDVGFLCYYEISSRNYYFLTNVSGVENLTSTHLERLKTLLIHDKSFFAAYTTQIAAVKM